MKQHRKYLISSSGFTLIELLVVVSILAAISMIGVSAVGNYIQKARKDLIHTELARIADAVMNFNADTGYFPGEGVFETNGQSVAEKADFSFLFYSPREEGTDAQHPGAEILPWDSDAGRGWNGPYLDPSSIDYMRTDAGDDLKYRGGIRIFPVNATRRQDANGIAALEDTFSARTGAGGKTDPHFVIRTESEEADVLWQAKRSAGRPYLYETAFKNDCYPECSETGPGCIALVSAGENGLFENGDNDDVVRIVRTN